MKVSKLSMQSEQTLRSIFGYRDMSKIKYDGRNLGFLTFYYYLAKKREISCSLVDRMTYIIRKPRKN